MQYLQHKSTLIKIEIIYAIKYSESVFLKEEFKTWLSNKYTSSIFTKIIFEKNIKHSELKISSYFFT